jgi:hypothetical protein
VLLVPNLAVAEAENALGTAGRTAVRAWVQGGGRYVGWQGGTSLAIRLGISAAAQTGASSAVPGSLFRVRVDQASPLAADVGAFAWQHYESDPLLRPGDAAQAVATYPPAASADWFVSGFAQGAGELAGTAAVVDEPAGKGRAVLFASEPNFRAYTDGTARLLLNAILGANPVRVATATATPGAQRAAGAVASSAVADDGAAIRIMVDKADEAATAAVLRSFKAAWSERPSGGRVTFVVANPQALGADEHPWLRRLPAALAAAGVVPVAVVAP